MNFWGRGGLPLSGRTFDKGKRKCLGLIGKDKKGRQWKNYSKELTKGCGFGELERRKP